MKTIYKIKHFFTVHKKEAIYFFLIYVFAMFPGLIAFEATRKNLQSEKFLMLLLLIMPTIPVSFFTEYSHRKMGYKKPIHIALSTFAFLNFLMILILNLDVKFLSSIYNAILIVLGSIFLIIGYFLVKDDTCSCEKD